MKAGRESDLVRACLDLLALRGITAWRNNNAGIYDPARRRFRTFHGLKGASDILGILAGGRFLAVECKMPGGKLSPDQTAFLDMIRERGGLAIVVHNVAELDAALMAEPVGKSTSAK